MMDRDDEPHAFAFGACFGCGRMFAFNPVYVPSIPINGVKQPICLDCVNIANPRRIKNGLAPIVPHPEAYEPIPEAELP